MLYQHRVLCARAVDPLDIAAGLEAAGVTDRTAARYRHRDVFSLAEEMYARTQRAETADDPQRLVTRPPEPLRHLLPAALAAAVAYTAAQLPPAPRALTAAAGTLVVAVTLHICLQRGPLGMKRDLLGGQRGVQDGPRDVPGEPRDPHHGPRGVQHSPRDAHHSPPGPKRGSGQDRGRDRGKPTAATATLALLAYAVFGDWLLADVLSGGTLDSPPHVSARTAAAAVALTAAALPLACIASWFAGRAHGRLAQSRDLAEFAARVRPLLAAVVVAAVLAVAALQCAAGQVVLARPGIGPAATALGLLLFLARLLAAHGQARPAAAGLNAAAAALALAVLLPLSARLPGLGPLGRPVELLVSAYGLAAVPAAICTTAALALLTRAATALTRASAHRKEHIQMTADTPAPHAPHPADPAHAAHATCPAQAPHPAPAPHPAHPAPPAPNQTPPTTPQGGPR